MSHPRVDIIILNWNNASDTIRCLDSVFSLKYDNFNVIVVDNGSDDDSVSEIKKFISEHDHQDLFFLLENETNLGFSGGVNVGIRHALRDGADQILLLNNDTIADEMFLRGLVEEGFKKNADMIAPAIYFEDQRDILWFGGKTSIDWLKMEHAITSELSGQKMPNGTETVEVNFLTGACILMKKKVVQELGGFDERFFLYFEDADLSIRAIKKGYKLVWTPKSKIWHKVSGTALSQAGSPLMNYYNVRNVLLLAKKHAPWWIRFIYMHVWAYYKFTKQLIKFAFSYKYNIELAKMIMKGIRDYYRGNFGKYKE